MTLKILQEAVQAGPEHWRWAVWIAGTTGELNTIEEVTWILHPSFANPVRRTKSRETGFRLQSSGWGEFMIKAEVSLTNGKVRRISHWLRLGWDERFLKENEVTPFVSGTETPARRPSVFLSYSKDNASLVRELVDALKGYRIDASIDEDVPLGVEFRRWIKEKIDSSDAVVALVSDDTSIWQESEIKGAIEAKVPVIPMAVGNVDGRKFRSFGDYTRSHVTLKTTGEVGRDAEELAKRIITLPHRRANA